MLLADWKARAEIVTRRRYITKSALRHFRRAMFPWTLSN